MASTSTSLRKKNVKPAFMFALAHEVTNPLANIDVSLVVLKSGLKDINQKAYLDIIKRSSHRINSIINQLLRCQNLDEVVLEQASMHQLLDKVLDIVKDRIELKQVTVIRKYAKQDCEMLLDVPKIIVALSNIMVNSIDSMVYDKGELTVITKVADGKCIVQIEDNGCGIAKTNLKYIFKPYYSKKPGHLGLGLSTANDILKASNIGIKVKSVVSKGTSIILNFDDLKGVLEA